MNLKEKVAVVTGAGSGIGRAISISLAKRGCRLALVDCHEQGLNETRQLLAGYATGISRHLMDVRNKEAVKALPAEVVQAHGAVDLLINNAGIAAGGSFLQMSEESFEQVIAVNFTALVQMTRAFLPLLLERREAQIVNLSSIFGLISPSEQTAYSASKFAVRGFSNALRHELQHTPVLVTVVYPGGIATSIARSALRPLGQSGEDVEQAILQSERYLRMPPAKAGEIIVEGIVSGKARILVGMDAKFISLLERFAPVGYWQILKRFSSRKAI